MVIRARGAASSRKSATVTGSGARRRVGGAGRSRAARPSRAAPRSRRDGRHPARAFHRGAGFSVAAARAAYIRSCHVADPLNCASAGRAVGRGGSERDQRMRRAMPSAGGAGLGEIVHRPYQIGHGLGRAPQAQLIERRERRWRDRRRRAGEATGARRLVPAEQRPQRLEPHHRRGSFNPFGDPIDIDAARARRTDGEAPDLRIGIQRGAGDHRLVGRRQGRRALAANRRTRASLAGSCAGALAGEVFQPRHRRIAGPTDGRAEADEHFQPLGDAEPIGDACRALRGVISARSARSTRRPGVWKPGHRLAQRGTHTRIVLVVEARDQRRLCGGTRRARCPWRPASSTPVPPAPPHSLLRRARLDPGTGARTRDRE